MKLIPSGLAAAVSLLLAASPLQAWAAQPAAPVTQTTVYLNGERLVLSAAPIMRDGTTLVPFRPIFEALGMPVAWDPQQRQIKGRSGQTDIVLTIGSRTATVNGKQMSLTAAPEAVNGAAYVPLRFVGEASQYAVAWNPASRTITLNRRTGSTTASSPTASTSAQSGQPNKSSAEQNAAGRINGEITGEAAGAGKSWNIELWQVLPDGRQQKHSDAVTDTLGRFSFSGLTIGQTYIAQGQWPDSASLRADRFVYQDDPPPILMQAMPNTAVIRFLLPDGEPTVSSDIRLVRSGPYSAQDEPGGIYHIDGTSTYLLTALREGGKYTVTAELDNELAGYTVAAPLIFTYAAGQQNRYDVQLREPSDMQLSGKVVDESGAPMHNIKVDFFDPNDGKWYRSAYTNKDGRYFMDGFAEGRRYSYIVRPPSPTSGTRSEFGYNANETFTYTAGLKELPTQTIRRVQLTGTVNSQQGAPAQAFVTLEDAAGKPIATYPAGEDGYFGLAGLIAGHSYTLTAVPLGSRITASTGSWLIGSAGNQVKKTFVFDPSKPTIEILLSAETQTPLLGGKIQTTDGQAAAQAKVYIEFTDGGASRSFTSTASSDGFFFVRTDGLKKGKAYAVSADGTMKSQTYTFTIEDNKVDLPALVLDLPNR
ncbi:stalk domain-containing protein [Paenibacillus aurantiacus]|uniref:Stalk domain-containing protein n=1 Tax=Paenibacillus aurantiacus TaxID=1936118 RepID=A0ABV5KVJ3_9BACL